MKLALNKIKQIPKNLGFGFCVYGKPTKEKIITKHGIRKKL